MNGRKSVELKLDPSPGIHRYYWNREFKDRAFTMEELSELDRILAAIVQEIDNSRVKRIYAKVKAEKDSDKIRKLIAPLTGGYLNYEFEDKFLISKAGAGTYKMTLSNGTQSSTSVLEIRNDPMD